jgi:hypothetical protein
MERNRNVAQDLVLLKHAAEQYSNFLDHLDNWLSTDVLAARTV